MPVSVVLARKNKNLTSRRDHEAVRTMGGNFTFPYSKTLNVDCEIKKIRVTVIKTDASSFSSSSFIIINAQNVVMMMMEKDIISMKK